MRLEQRLTPQLIQSMAVLQKPVAELEHYIADALERNAALEVAEPEADERERRATDGNGRDNRESEQFARLDRFARENREIDPDWTSRPPSGCHSVAFPGTAGIAGSTEIRPGATASGRMNTRADVVRLHRTQSCLISTRSDPLQHLARLRTLAARENREDAVVEQSEREQ
jgi:hypothetical protein